MIVEGKTQLLYCNAILSFSTQRRMTIPESYLLINEPVVCMQFNPKHLTPLYIHTRIVIYPDIYPDQTISFMIFIININHVQYQLLQNKLIFSAVSGRQLFLRQRG